MRNQRIITIQYIKNFLKEIDSKSELLSDEYIDNSKPLKFKCCCGTEFNRCFSNIQQRKSCQCISCGHKIRISYIDIKNKSYIDVINSIVTK